jgi:hypothetical protein
MHEEIAFMFFAVSMITDPDEQRRLPTAFDVQTVIDIRELLHDLRKMERLHENRALPTMSLVINGVVEYSARVRRFIGSFDDDDNNGHLVDFGKALLAHGESYFKRAFFVFISTFANLTAIA